LTGNIYNAVGLLDALMPRILLMVPWWHYYMCSLKSVFLVFFTVKYDVRLFFNASTSYIFNKFDGTLFQSLMVRGKKL
jgi:hypothetical protein